MATNPSAGSISLKCGLVNRNSCTFTYKPNDNWIVPDNETESKISWEDWIGEGTSSTRTGTSTQIVYDYSQCEFKWTWTFSSETSTNVKNSDNKTGSLTISGFSAGAQHSLNAKLIVKRQAYKKTITYSQTRTRSKTGEDEKGNPTYSSWSYQQKKQIFARYSRDTNEVPKSDYTYPTATNSLIFFTKPAEFTWGTGVALGQTIQCESGLSASKWNTLVIRTEQRTNWENQSGGASYPGAEVSSGELIKASKYNILADALGVSNVTGGKNGTLISASVFIALQTAVNA